MKVSLLLWVFIFVPCFSMRAQDAPVTTIGTISTFDSEVTVPVRVSGFTNIGSFGLQLSYDPEVAIATAVTAGALLGGNMNVNIELPGTIILGWYIYPGTSLPDSTVIFRVVFSKAATGTSGLAWVDDGFSCYYSDTAYQVLNDLPAPDFYFNGSVNFLTEAPVTAAPSFKAGAGSEVDIPVKVTGFAGIGRVKLTMDYDPSILDYQSWTNTSGYPGLSVDQTVPGEILTEGLVEPGGPGMTLSDSSVLYTLHFLYSGGSTGLNWKTEGGSCEFAGAPPSYPVLFDVPKTSYYINGAVTPAVGESEPSGTIFAPVFYPSPFSGRGTLRWFAPSASDVSVEINDLAGRTIESYRIAVERPGEQHLEVSSERFLPGIYLIRVITNTAGKITTGSVKIVCIN
jgi:hypothetical protein